MLHHVDIDSRAKWLLARHFGRALHDLIYREIRLLRMFSMEERSSNPDLVSYLNLCS
jgi:hypothetical protein